jgi:hypothetical protein
MKLDPGTADLGYRFSRDLRSVQPPKLATANDFRRAMEEGVKRISRARTRPVILEIVNLVSLSVFVMIYIIDIFFCRSRHL